MAYDKTVFILGAGASAQAGAPVINNFLMRARELLDNRQSNLDQCERDAFSRVLEWRSNIYPVLRFLKIDLDNIEDLFSLVDMAEQIDFQNAKELYQVRNDLIRLICRTLELTIIDHSIHNNFIEMLIEKEKNMQRPETEQNSIITLNYDTAIEHNYLQSFKYNIHQDEPGRLKLLKLHGSVNWGTCLTKNCAKDVKVFEIYGTGAVDHITRIYNDVCLRCGKNLTPFIVPPTWNKVSYGETLKAVWVSARMELKEASRLIIIGYSLPQTDSFFKYLLALGLADNKSLQEIILIDSAQGKAWDSLKNRYLEFIAPFFDDRNFYFWKCTFNDVIKKAILWKYLNNKREEAIEDAIRVGIIQELGRASGMLEAHQGPLYRRMFR